MVGLVPVLVPTHGRTGLTPLLLYIYPLAMQAHVDLVGKAEVAEVTPQFKVSKSHTKRVHLVSHRPEYQFSEDFKCMHVQLKPGLGLREWKSAFKN